MYGWPRIRSSFPIEKINMLDYADLVVINKFDKREL
jgi:putative protein kinase ArgK-like GTPase of G3E family